MLFIARNDYNYEILFVEVEDLKEANTLIFGLCEQSALWDLENQGLEQDWSAYYDSEVEARTAHVESVTSALYDEWTVEEVKTLSDERCESIALSVLNETNSLWTGYYVCDTNEVDQELANDFYSDDFDLYRVGNSDEVLFLRRA